MKRKVRVKRVPMANGGQSGASKGLERFMYGKNSRGNGMNQFSEPDFEVNNSISSVPREMSNLEAEGGEMAVVPGQGGIPETYNITGPRHNQGGVPLNLEEDSFVFSDNKKGMKIKDKEILADFGVSTPKNKKKAKGKTPAELAKKYNINEYKKILLDPNSDRLERETAEKMIANYNEKLGKLALVQESMKGFPQGIPEIAKPYADSIGIQPEMFAPPQAPQMPAQAAYGTGVLGKDGLADYTVKNGGQTKRKVKVYPTAQRGGEFKGAFWDSVLNAQDGTQVPAAPAPDVTAVKDPEFMTEYMLDDKGNIIDARYGWAEHNLEKQGDSGTDYYDITYTGNTLGNNKSYGMGKDAFIYGAGNRSGALNSQMGKYQTYVALPGQEDPYAAKLAEYKRVNPEKFMASKDKAMKDYQKMLKQRAKAAAKANPSTLEYGGGVYAQKGVQKNDPFYDIKLYDENGNVVKPNGKNIDPGFYNTVLYDEQGRPIPIGSKGVPLADITAEDLGARSATVAEYDEQGNPINPLTGEAIVGGDQYDVPAKYQNNPAYQVDSPQFDESALEEGDWVQLPDGEWQQYIGTTGRASYAGSPEEFQTLFGGNEDFGSAYAELLIPFSDPEVIKQFGEYTRQSMKKERNYKGKSKMNKRYTDDEIANFTDEDIVKNFLEMQKRNYALQANNIHPALFADRDGALGTKQQYLERLRRNKKLMDKSDPLYNMSETEALELYNQYKDQGLTSLNSAFEQLGLPVTKDMAKLQQSSYWGYKDLLNARDKGELSPEVAAQLDQYSAPVRGYSDEGQTGDKRTSPADGVYTNTTSAQLAVGRQPIAGYRKPGKKAPEPKKPAPEKPEYVEFEPRDEWWAQDIGNIGNLMGQRLGLKKYLPHSFPVELKTPDPVYLDPSRALAANAEQAAIANQTLAAFAGPQGTFRATGIMGEGLKNAANIVADYQTKNVGIANQYGANRAATQNRQALFNAQLADKMYDENIIANQQFDNAVRQADRNVFEAWRQGLTNKKMTQAMNSMYPQFETRPGIGGGLYRTGFERPLTGKGSTRPNKGTSYLEEYSKLKNQFGDRVSDSAIKKQVEINLGASASDPSEYDRDLAAQKAIMKMYGNAAGNPSNYRGY